MKKPEKNLLEWVVFIVGLVLSMSTLAYLAYDGLTIGERPPLIEVRTGAPQQQTFNYIVPVFITNHGDLTAEGVHVEVVLEGAGTGQQEERAEFTVAFVPRGSTREGWVGDDVLKEDVAMRAELVNVPVPADYAKFFDYSIVKKIYRELKASGWKPSRAPPPTR